MSKLANVFIISDKAARLPELMAAGVALGDKVSAIVVGAEADAKNAISYGANVAYLLDAKSDVIFEDFAPSFAKIVKDAGNGLVVLPASKRGKALAAKLAVLLKAPAVTEAAEIVADGGAVTVKHMVYGGLAHGTEKLTGAFAIITLGAGAYEAAAANASAAGEVKKADFVAPAKAIKLVERRAKAGSAVDLNKAKRVVCVGRGFGKKDDLAMADQLAKAIEAEVGCSRPIAEGEGWMERERYVGVSGVMLKSDVYFAVGVSGQIQHMVGANASKTIIAINKDKNAPIFNFTDYGIVGDLYKVVPGLIKALKG